MIEIQTPEGPALCYIEQDEDGEGAVVCYLHEAVPGEYAARRDWYSDPERAREVFAALDGVAVAEKVASVQRGR